jgi:hypothetical protein
MRLGPWVPSRSEAVGVLFVLVVIGGILFVWVQYPGFRGATGFGPDWNCTSVAKGDPICVKKPAK